MSVGSIGKKGFRRRHGTPLVRIIGLFGAFLCVAWFADAQTANQQQSPEQLTQAAQSYEKFLDANTATPQARLEVQQRLGAVYYLLHRYRDSLNILTTALGSSEKQTSKAGGASLSGTLAAQSWLVVGLDYSELNELPAAAKALRRSLTLQTDSANARLALGDVLARSDRMLDAEAEYEEQTRRTPSLADAWYKLGLVHSQLSAEISREKAKSADQSLLQQLAAEELLAKGENLNAARVLFRVARSSPDQPEVHADLGMALLRLGYLKTAQDQFTQELARNPESPSAALGLAEAAALNGAWEQVAAQLERLSTRQPKNQMLLMESPPAGVLLQASIKGDLHPSETFMQSAAGSLWKSWLSDSDVVAQIEQNPDSSTCAGIDKQESAPGIWMTEACYSRLVNELKSKARLSDSEKTKLIEAEFRLGQYRSALNSAAQLHTDEPSNGWGIYWLSKAHDATAEECFLKVAALNPDSARVHEMLAEHYTKLADYPKAKAEYEDAIRLTPQSPDLHLGLGTVLSRAGELTQAEKELKTTIEDTPKSAFAHYELGHLYLLQSRWPDAIAQLQQVPADTTIVLNARLDLAKAEAEVGQTSQAIKDLLSVSSKDQDGEVYFRLAALYREIGDDAHAHEALLTFKQRRSASLDTDNDELRDLEKEQEAGTIRTSPPAQ